MTDLRIYSWGCCEDECDAGRVDSTDGDGFEVLLIEAARHHDSLGHDVTIHELGATLPIHLGADPRCRREHMTAADMQNLLDLMC